jgi:hypothetical protein
MGNTCVKLYMIIISYVYKKPFVILARRSAHKFQMCKEGGFTNIKFDSTQQHDSLTKLGFIKSTSLKHVIFERSCKLHHIAYLTTTNYLWLPLITLLKCRPIIWRPHWCAHNVLNSPLYLWIWVTHVMDLFSKWHFGWIVHKIFYNPIITLYVLDLKVMVCCLVIHQGKL